MQRYIQSVQINKVRHLHDLDIYIPDDVLPHLLITGKHVSGKTSLLSDSNNSSVETVDFCNSLQ